MKSRTTRPSSAASTSSSGDRCVSAPSQNVRPMTADWRSARRSSGPRRSILAAIRACTVSGIRSAEAAPSSSASIRMVSSTKSGLPPVFSISATTSSGARPVRCSSVESISSTSCGASGSSSIEVARTRPPPQPGRTSSSSGRARQRRRIGASRTQAARCSISSSSGSSAQWMSSKTRTSGCTPASRSDHSRTAQAISCWLDSLWTASSTPEASPRRSAIASSSQQTFSFSTASLTGSSSVIPAETLTISATGQ